MNTLRRTPWIAGAACLATLAGISTVFAMSHANSLKFPIVGYFEECNADDSTTTCQLATSGNASGNAQLGDWRFAAGTVEINDAGKVSLRVDEITPTQGSCPGGVGGLLCRCNGSGGFCSLDSDCSGSQRCWVKNGTKLKVEVFAQNYVEKHPFLPAPCNSFDCIRRSFTATNDCHETFEFTLTAGSTDTNTGNGAWTCAGNLSHLPGEIREVQVRIEALTPSGGSTIPEQMLGVMSSSQQ